MKSMEFNLDNDKIIDGFVEGAKNIKSTEDFNKLVKQLAEAHDQMKYDEFKARTDFIKETIIANYSKILPNLGENDFNVTSILQAQASNNGDLRPIKIYLKLNNIESNDDLNKTTFDNLCTALEKSNDLNNTEIMEIKELISNLKESGFDLNTVVEKEGKHDSILMSLLRNPTNTNFELFKYLVEEQEVSIENTVRCKDQTLDAQKDPFSSEDAKKFLDYIDINTNNDQKNIVQLIRLAMFFNYEELFKKLLDNNEIVINGAGNRGARLMVDVYSNDLRFNLAKITIDSNRFNDEKITGPMRKGHFTQLWQPFEYEMKQNLSNADKLNALFDKAIDDVKDYSTFNEEVNNALPTLITANISSGDQQLSYLIKYCNAVKIDSNILFDKAHLSNEKELSQISIFTDEEINSLSLKLPFFLDPTLLHHLQQAANNNKIKKQMNPEEKLFFVLDGVKQFKGLDLEMYVSDTHIKILKTLNTLSKAEIQEIAKKLELTNDAEINEYLHDLKKLNGRNGIEGINKLKDALLENIAEKKQPGLLSRAFSKLFSIFIEPIIKTFNKNYTNPPIINNINFQEYLPQENRSVILENLSTRIENTKEHNKQIATGKGVSKTAEVEQSKIDNLGVVQK